MKSLYFLLIPILFSCNSRQDNQIESNDWFKSWNALYLPGDIHQLYSQDAGLYWSDTLEAGITGVSSTIKKVKNQIGVLQLCNSVNQTASNEIDYLEIGTCTVNNQKPIIYLNAWKKDSTDSHTLELQILQVQENSDTSYFSDIHKVRVEWVQLSNAQNVRELLENTYTPDAIYFSGGKITKGREAIIERYSYMNQTTWKIQLYAKQLIPARPDLVFEIGNYISSGKGQYVLIWEKTASGKWMISFDFNF